MIKLKHQEPNEKAEKLYKDDRDLRLQTSQVSSRIPRNLISLLTQPSANIGIVGGGSENLVGQLDEKIVYYKEVEDLYEEIMKTIKEDHLNNDEENEYEILCPTAPDEEDVVPSNEYLGFSAYADPVLVSESRTRNIMPATAASTVDKKKKRYKFNLGGYVSSEAKAKASSPEDPNGFHLKGYIDHLRSIKTDFVLDLMIDEDAEQRARHKAEEEQMRNLKQEAEGKLLEAMRSKKKDKRENMMKFSRGKWNPGLLDYFDEIHARKNDPEQVEDEFEEKNTEEELKVEQENQHVEDGEKSQEDSESYESSSHSEKEERNIADPEMFPLKPKNPKSIPRINIETRMTPLEPSDSLIDIPNAQSELESIWFVMKMPLDQKLDMAIKYSNPKFAIKLDIAIILWKTCAKDVILREEMLTEIESFEIVASNPE